MAVSITDTLLKILKSKSQCYEVYDSKLPGLMVRVYPTGRMAYLLCYTRGKKPH